MAVDVAVVEGIIESEHFYLLLLPKEKNLHYLKKMGKKTVRIISNSISLGVGGRWIVHDSKIYQTIDYLRLLR